MAYGALKSAEAVARALASRDISPERVSKAFRHMRTREEYGAVYDLLLEDDQQLMEAEARKRGLDW